jgi:transcriptional regulator with PAS, ATPase and Fis domain
LNVFPVKIPPLRERLEDLPLLAEHFLKKFHNEYNKRTLGLSDKALELCLRYRWPGNIRELENVIERGVILTDSNETISQDSLFAVFPDDPDSKHEERLNATGQLVDVQSTAVADGDWASRIIAEGISLEVLEQQLMLKAMQMAEQNVSKAARLLGLSRPALAYRLKKSDVSHTF